MEILEQLEKSHWVIAGLSMMAYFLSNIDKVSQNRIECLHLLECVIDLAQHAVRNLKNMMTAEEAETVRQNVALGIVAGITISFPENSSRAKGAMGLIADPGIDAAAVDVIFAEKREEIMAVANMMHLRMIQLPFPSRRRPLTERQREALEWVADGKTSQDVALLMEVSPAMVEKHLRLARDALSVDTTTQAVAKAALMNLIFQNQATTPERSVLV